MFRSQEIIELYSEVYEAIEEVYVYAKKTEKNENDYILFLAPSY